MEKRMIHRKLVRAVFWLIILYTAATATAVLAIQFGLLKVPETATLANAQSGKDPEEHMPVSLAAFAEQFTKEYLFWTAGKEDSRAERLRPFWKPGLDVQGGLEFSKAGWNSYTRQVSTWEMKERKDGSGITDVTVYAETILTRTGRGNDQKRVDRWISVPVRKAGESYVVVELPKIIPAPVVSVPEEEPVSGNKGETVNSSVRAEAEAFLRSFWKVYTTGEPREIAYFRKDNRPVPGLTGVMRFEDLKDLEVTEQNGEMTARFRVELEDLASGVKMTTRYEFKLVREGNRWFVLKMGQGEI
ncbi:conjugal transfer protein [Staphylospora marina]|uniref:conjugal transfer protein n=1 Tax=Staphylospora marina TaxID=2490858 RepID=UPI0013DE39BF|nr:conjugal transfer protein [Staphylospora marina]